MIARTIFLSFLLTPLVAAPQPPAVQAEILKIDTLAADADTRPAVVSALADALKVHRNHVIRLRKETGQTFGEIFVQSLDKEEMSEDQILMRTYDLEVEIRKRMEQARSDGEPALAPVLDLSTGLDHNSAGTFFRVNPEVGIVAKHASFVAGVPYYRDSAGGTSFSGVGDVYLAGSLYGPAAGMDWTGSLTIGLPTGDQNIGMGAGKTTVDVSGTIAHSFGRLRSFVSGGFANSIFNFAYARPYIEDGNAAHVSGGAELHVAGRVSFGLGGFGVMPTGNQVVYSRITAEPASTVAQGSGAVSSPSPGGANSMAGMGGGAGQGPAYGQPQMPVKVPGNMPFLATTGGSVPANELKDYGGHAWASVTVARGVAVDLAAARSVPFQLTTVHVGLHFDLARLFFPAWHF